MNQLPCHPKAAGEYFSHKHLLSEKFSSVNLRVVLQREDVDVWRTVLVFVARLVRFARHELTD